MTSQSCEGLCSSIDSTPPFYVDSIMHYKRNAKEIIGLPPEKSYADASSALIITDWPGRRTAGVAGTGAGVAGTGAGVAGKEAGVSGKESGVTGAEDRIVPAESLLEGSSFARAHCLMISYMRSRFSLIVRVSSV